MKALPKIEFFSETYNFLFFVFLRLWARLEPRDAFPYIKCAKRTHFPFGETRKTEVFQYLQKMKVNHENEHNVRYFGKKMLQQKKCCTSRKGNLGIDPSYLSSRGPPKTGCSTQLIPIKQRKTTKFLHSEENIFIFVGGAWNLVLSIIFSLEKVSHRVCRFQESSRFPLLKRSLDFVSWKEIAQFKVAQNNMPQKKK